MTYLFFNIHRFLGILKPALLSHTNTQRPDIIAYLLVDFTTCQMSLCTGLTVYNQVKKLIMGKWTSVLGQKNSTAHGRVGVFQIVFSLSGE